MKTISLFGQLPCASGQ